LEINELDEPSDGISPWRQGNPDRSLTRAVQL
jgi:hypothetical protein